MKALILESWGSAHIITLNPRQYTNGRLAIEMIDWDEGWPEPWSTLTVNIPEYPVSNENCAFIDTNNNGNDIVFWLMENGLGRATAKWAYSGFCSYPEFEFNMDEVKKYVVPTGDDDDERVCELVRDYAAEYDDEEREKREKEETERKRRIRETYEAWLREVEELRKKYRPLEDELEDDLDDDMVR